MPSITSANGPRLGLTLAPSKTLSIRDLLEVASAAERAGFDSLWLPETWGHDAATLLAAVARHTERIKLASGVFNVFSRSATLIAQTAATLQELSGGRFILGLGASGPGVVERWHGVAYERPVQRTREYVAAIRVALAGERVDVEGQIVRVHDFRLLNAPEHHVPIYIAALGPRNIRMTGAVADGWLPIFAARGHITDLQAKLEAGARSAGRDPRSIDIAAYLPFMVGARSEQLLRQQLAYYLGGMGTFYAEFVARLGLEDSARRVRALWQSGDRVGAVNAVDSSLLDLCTLGYTAEHARSRLQQYRSEGVQLPVAALPHGCSLTDALQSVQALAGATRP